MKLLGLTPEDVATAVEVWPDNWPAIELFSSLRTQWRMGFNGPTGLDYGALPAALRLRGTPRADWPELFTALQVMEAAALDEIHKER